MRPHLPARAILDCFRDLSEKDPIVKKKKKKRNWMSIKRRVESCYSWITIRKAKQLSTKKIKRAIIWRTVSIHRFSRWSSRWPPEFQRSVTRNVEPLKILSSRALTSSMSSTHKRSRDSSHNKFAMELWNIWKFDCKILENISTRYQFFSLFVALKWRHWQYLQSKD